MINLELIWKSLGYVLGGLPYTLGISLLSFTSGLFLGLILALLGRSKQTWLRQLIKFYVSFMRGVPMIVVLFVLYFGLPYYGFQLPALLCALIGFTMVSAAYMAEVFRGSIEAVDFGQWEAARALGLPYASIVKQVILPQAFRIAVPSLGNVIIDMVKSSSLTAMITVPDIFQNAKIIGSREWDYMSMYILVALIYWGITIVLEKSQAVIEEKLAY
ncbi:MULTISPECIES: amino acid ABC transporter permease [Streptococcus]|uniref:ABC transporter, permease protein n=3 Tax=Streptococcus parauberis TaxID=1348 RepID=F1Z103_9STRE|nr:amino acid ABC transporter permease [Streptococcus parauberis]AUT06267.1 Arginine transport system permease protein ArtQ [Streptococcus parauberis]EGE54402.1 ABC transporter, permease protein [Streptococcus parauberis NCFD 2020]EMF49976.1 amino acid ABC transporter, permease protein [Streptococcus parauberis KRS-02109]EMG25724.1 amino acid ABC transporter, permease protein [Streptococcus parauberis KRS-02083]KYP20837.1 Inner membrane amino-acid ABC transporter permease protein YecS [Strepto